MREEEEKNTILMLTLLNELTNGGYSTTIKTNMV